MRRSLLVLLLVPRLALADAPKLTLTQVIEKAVANPKVEMAEGDIDSAAARSDEANAARLPRIKVTAFGTISPEIKCEDPDCLHTSPRNFAFRFDGLFGTAGIDLTEPLYTFGKIGHAREAAKAGLAAQKALADEAAGDAAVDAGRAYWGLKLSRELGGMLDDGIEEIGKATKDFAEKPGVTVQDRQRVAVLLAEAKAQRAEAAQAEGQALAGLRAITADTSVDIDDSELAAIDYTLPTDKAAHDAAQERRPQKLAAEQGAKAGDELAQFEASQYFPDIALVASAVVSHAQGVQDPPSAFAYDPYRRTGAGAGIGLQWTLEPWNVAARTDRAKAEAHKLRAQAQLAAVGASYDVENALAEAKAAKDKVAATVEGEKAARTWLAAVLQNEAIGTAEAKDLADAYVAWFQMRARWAAAVMQWNVAVLRVQRATGEFRAGRRVIR
ncbi:MAG: TolC family protein [Deltaproteobacteria bacterium]|nr:TolC family protein [Deltaproteobacteria bacterium]